MESQKMDFFMLSVLAGIKTRGLTQNGEALVQRPWGTYESIIRMDNFQVKHIIVSPGAALSSQLHFHRSEHWVVVKGVADVSCGDHVFQITANQSTYIPKQTIHRLSNSQKTPLHLIEVQIGDYLGEDDIVRFDDIYGRSLMTST